MRDSAMEIIEFAGFSSTRAKGAGGMIGGGSDSRRALVVVDGEWCGE
jgi:hypothetical protein